MLYPFLINATEFIASCMIRFSAIILVILYYQPHMLGFFQAVTISRNNLTKPSNVTRLLQRFEEIIHHIKVQPEEGEWVTSPETLHTSFLCLNLKEYNNVSDGDVSQCVHQIICHIINFVETCFNLSPTTNTSGFQDERFWSKNRQNYRCFNWILAYLRILSLFARKHVFNLLWQEL